MLINRNGSSQHSENARQWIHIGSGLFALLLRVLSAWQAAGMAAIALVFNVALLPRLGGRRRAETDRDLSLC